MPAVLILMEPTLAQTIGLVVDGRVTIPTQEGFIVDFELVKTVDGSGSFEQTDNTVHTILLQDQIAENSMAINNKAIYLVTGAAGKKDHANASGGFHAFQAGTDSSTTVYNEI
ncbi:hypothetical protein N0V90_011930 [Kalmusia sp. IMI 367209]|nr:hypothetical protein N0V90_011930 [Kalmusia sp. IMI 367209]